MTLGIQRMLAEMERVTDAFQQALYADGDVDAALAMTAAGCAVTNLPMHTGVEDGAALRGYLEAEVVAHIPADLTVRRVSRTVDQRRVVDETIVVFTHDRDLPWLLPGRAATHRRVEVLAISIVAFHHEFRMGSIESRIRDHRTLWDASGLPGAGE